MKTFDEAIKSVVLVRADQKENWAFVADKQLKGASMIQEIVESQFSSLLAVGLMQKMEEESFHEFLICVKNAIAQGVLIGIEMERQDAEMSQGTQTD